VLANVTHLGLLLKVGDASGLVWVTRFDSGLPVEGALVRVLTPGGREAFRGRTDASGLLRTPGANQLLDNKSPALPREEWGVDRTRRLIVLVEKEDELAVVDGNWQNGIQIWNFGVTPDHRAAATRVRGFLESDRGIYRPGETVHLKGLVREVAIGQPPRVPAGRVEVAVFDAREREVKRVKLAPSPFGGFWLDLPIAESAPVGDWRVEASLGEQRFDATFFVEEFRRQELEIKAADGPRDVVVAAGKRLTIAGQASYLFGGAVAGREVTYTVMGRPRRVTAAGLPGYVFGASGDDPWAWWAPRRDSERFVTDGTIETDAAGRFAVRVVHDPAGSTGPRDYIAEIALHDATGQVIDKRLAMTVHPTDRYVGLHAQELLQAAGMPFAVGVVAVDVRGQQVAGEAELSWVKRGTWRWRQPRTDDSVVWTRKVTIPATGQATERINPADGGEYELRVTMKDTRGRATTTAMPIWVLGRGEAFWSGDESDRMPLVADRADYRPGDTARLIPRAGFAGVTRALVTLERNGVLDARVVALEGGAVAVPIVDAHAPNVFASVAVVRGRVGAGDRDRPRFQIGVAELRVSAESQRLTVAIVPARATFRPGERVEGVVRVTDARGAPVEAEVALSVADEAILQVIGYETPDPLRAIYAPWGLGVDTATTLNRLAKLGDPDVADPDEGGDGPASGPSRSVRSRLLASAFWQPALVTDARGEAPFAFTLADNLTAFRLMAAVADRGARFGAAEARITVSKPLMAQPALPRFVTAGDHATLGVVVHNRTAEAQRVTVTAAAEGITLDGKSTTVLQIAAGGEARARWRGRVGSGVGKATVRFTAALPEDRERDAVEVTLPVARGLDLDKRTLVRGEVSGAVVSSVAWEAGDALDASRLEVAVDPLGMSQLGASLRELVEYPYGCLEQTLSRLLPLIAVKELTRSLSLGDLDRAKLDEYVAAGVAKLARHQGNDGDFALWPGGTTEPHLTAYALHGLAEARRAGVAVDEEAVRRGLEALRRWVNGRARLDQRYEAATMAEAAWVMAELGRPDRALVERLFAARSGMPLYGRAFLLWAMVLDKKSSRDDVARLGDELAAAVPVVDGRAAIGDDGEGGAGDAWLSSDTRSTAIVLRALIAAGASQAVRPLADALVAQQGHDGSWRSTQESSWALLALADVARQRKRALARGGVHVVVRAGSRVVIDRRLKSGELVEAQLPLVTLAAGRARGSEVLTVRSDGPVTAQVRLVRARPLPPDASAQSLGLAITRRYLDAESGAELAQVRAGQLVKVQLTVEAKRALRHVAVEDRLPAGLEAVAEQRDQRRDDDERDAWSSDGRARRGGGPWVHEERRDDRVWAFAEALGQGRHELTYLARATTPGRFTALPARAEDMYHPEIAARTVAQPVEVR